MATYRELDVYQKAYALVLEVYSLTRKIPQEERYGLVSQMRRAAVSIPLNIAEGYGRQEGSKEIKHFLSMARGSGNEMEVLLELASDLGYMPESECEPVLRAYAEVGRMLSGLMRKLG